MVVTRTVVPAPFSSFTVTPARFGSPASCVLLPLLSVYTCAVTVAGAYTPSIAFCVWPDVSVTGVATFDVCVTTSPVGVVTTTS